MMVFYSEKSLYCPEANLLQQYVVLMYLLTCTNVMQVISFLHQMVETLGTAVFPALPTIVQQLLTDCEVFLYQPWKCQHPVCNPVFYEMRAHLFKLKMLSAF
jgi:hypothetical protein